MKKLLCLDRDGVLNAMVIDPEQGTVDSPLHPSQVRVFPEIPSVLKRIETLGFDLVIVSNQPAAAKGKTTQANLLQVHTEVIRQIESAGAQIQGSYICFHRAEEKCRCRKPATGLLEQAFADHPMAVREASWMAGDGVSDIQAGQAFGLQTVFLAKHKCDVCQTLEKQPDLWADDLSAFAESLTKGTL